MPITLRHPGTQDIKVVKIGWSWSLFLAGGFLGLPLFFRGLALWGAVILVAWCLRLAVPFMAESAASADELGWILTMVLTALCFYCGLKGNALTARRYFDLGYRYDRPESPEARIAQESWGV